MASEQGPRYDLIYQNNDAARNEQLRHTVTSLADKLAATTDRAKAAEADNAQQADRIAALEAEVARLRLEGQRLATTVGWVADGQGQADGMVRRAKEDLVAWRAALAAAPSAACTEARDE